MYDLAIEEIEKLNKEIERLKSGIKFALDSTHDDDTWDYLNHLLEGTESEARIHLFKGGN